MDSIDPGRGPRRIAALILVPFHWDHGTEGPLTASGPQFSNFNSKIIPEISRRIKWLMNRNRLVKIFLKTAQNVDNICPNKNK